MSGTSSSTPWKASFDRLATDLRSSFDAWASSPEPWPEPKFSDLAMAVFDFQFRFNQAYRSYCERRGVTPDTVEDWECIPPVPTAVFREIDLVAGDPSMAQLTFRTSGTTRGADRRGRHLVLDEATYRSASRSAFRVLALPRAPIRMCTLHDTFTHSPDSSLSWMLDDLMVAFGSGDSLHAADESGLDFGAATEFCVQASERAEPVYLLGTTLAFDEWMRWMRDGGCRIELPAGSRVMDTGGSKGRPGLAREHMIASLAERLGVGPSNVLNEFGMTELLSQRYSVRRSGAELLAAPPWLRTRTLDPVTLEQLPDGVPGILCHFDLANFGSVSMVLTEDMGITRGTDIEWLGRTPGAPPRGCSLATAELLEARRVP